MIAKVLLAALFASSAVAYNYNFANKTTTTTQTTIPVTSTLPYAAPFSVTSIMQTFRVTVTLTPKDSSASSDPSSGDSLASIAKPFGSVPHGSSLRRGDSSASDSWGSAESSGFHASGSFGSYIQIWHWIVLALLLCICCAVCGLMSGGKKKRATKKKKKIVSDCVLTKDANAGETKMQVGPDDAENYFKVGDQIDVGPGTPEHEVITAKAFGSIICKDPLKNDHPKGTRLVKALLKAAEEMQPLLAPALMPLVTTSMLVAAPQQTYSYVAAPQQTYSTYVEPQQTYSYAPASQYATYAAPQSQYAATTAYAQPQMGGYGGSVI